MQYVLMIYEDEANYRTDREDALPELIDKHIAFGREHGDVIRGGEGLMGVRSATTLRTKDGGQMLHDGPFAETKEQLGGFYVIDVPDLDAAIAVAKKVPLMKNGSVEIRPTMPAPPR